MATALLAKGQSGQVFLYDSTTVHKIPWPNRTERDLAIERRAYERLGSHPLILQYKGELKAKGKDERERESEDGCHAGILLRYHPRGTLRSLIQNSRSTTDTDTATNESASKTANVNEEAADVLCRNRYRWAVQLAEAVVYIHSKHIIHCDISSANILLSDDGRDIIVCDFAGCSMDGCKEFNPLAVGRPRCARWYKFLDTVDEYGIKEDIFSIGSVLYEIYTGNRIWGQRTDDEKVLLYRKGMFPDVMEIEVGNIIRRCWHDCYESAEDVLRALSNLCPEHATNSTSTMLSPKIHPDL